MFLGAKVFAVGVLATLLAARDFPFEEDLERAALDFFVDDLAKTLRSFRKAKARVESLESSNELPDNRQLVDY